MGPRADDRDAFATIAGAAAVPTETLHAMPFEVRASDVVGALASIEGFARRVRAEEGLPEPVPHTAH